ncbi:MAG: ABC transporter permease [Bacteroidota bacterium]
MLRNYIKIAFRNLLKNKGLTVINLIGLSTGFAITLLIVLYVQFERSYENMHPTPESTVRLTLNYLTGNTVTTEDSEMYPAVGKRIKDEITEVESYTRAYAIGEPYSPMQVGEKEFLMKELYAVDADFFKMFNYPLLHGNPNNLFQKPNEAVITESTALKYFNRTNVVGETLESTKSSGTILYNIVGVTNDSPANTHLKFDMLISYPTMLSEPEMKNRHYEKEDNWDGNNSYMYVKLAKGADYEKFESSLEAFNKQLVAEEKIESEAIVAQKMTDIHLHSKKTFEPETNGDANAVLFLFIVSILIIVSAFVNYINLTTAKALDRAKEVGVKKVLGSTNSQLRLQFLTESLVMNVLAACLSVILVAVSKSNFIRLSGLPDDFLIFGNLTFWLLLVVFIIVGGLLSGLYPAFVLSSFKAATILKGSYSHSVKGNELRKGLVVFQFAITIILLIQTFTVNEQLNFIRDLDKGVNVDKSIVIEAPTKNATSNYSAFKQELLSNPNIKTVSLSHTVPGLPSGALSTTANIHVVGVEPDEYHNFYLTFVDEDYAPLLGLDILSGANFDINSTIEKRELLVNSEALKRWNIANAEEAVGKKLAFWGAEWTIKGVVNDYHQLSPKSPMLPMLHIFNNTFRGLATVQFTGGSSKDNLAYVEQTFSRMYPGAAFSYFFMDQEYDNQYKAEDRFKQVFMILSVVAILIACLGLLGLASFAVAKRKKEIGIRKVVGASTTAIMVLLSKDFVKTVLISVIISVPITYLLMDKWLNNFANKIEVHAGLFVLPIIVVFAMVLLSISFKTIKTAVANPVNSLRSE